MIEVDFSEVIQVLRMIRDDTMNYSPTRPHTAEYCYQLISLLMETEKMMNGKFFSTDYIDEKTEMLAQIAHNVWEEETRRGARIRQ